MSVFSAAMDVLFEDANMAADATYTPVASGTPVTVRAVRSAPDVVRDYGGAALHSDSVVFEVRISEVAAPVAGDVLVYDGESRVVQGAPERDVERLTWLLDTRPA